jgi:hypothetical protein
MSKLIPNIEGDWKMSLAGDGDKSAICTLIQAGNVLTGTFRGPLGHLPVTGAISTDGKITFLQIGFHLVPWKSVLYLLMFAVPLSGYWLVNVSHANDTSLFGLPMPII